LTVIRLPCRPKDEVMSKVTDACHRWGVPAIVLAGAGLLAAACGGDGSPASTAQTAYQKSLAYSQCMRGHGVAGFPDPQPNGAILTGPQDHLAQGSPQFVAANKACQHLLPPVHPMTAAQQHEATVQALKFVACMRSHGLPGMADPVVSATGINIQIPTGIKPNSPVFQSAQRACRKLVPAGPP
jgi:hypothetical protein